MKNKNTVIKVVAVIIAAAVFYLSLFTTGEKAFDMETMDTNGELTVLRIDSGYPEYNSKEPYGLRETYLLNEAQKAELLDFIAQSRYRKRISINAFTFIPGISLIQRPHTKHTASQEVPTTIGGNHYDQSEYN